MRAGLLVLGLGAALALAAGLWLMRSAPGPAPAAVADEPTLATRPSGPRAGRAEELPPLPHSLRGSSPPGRLRVDAEGRFVPTRDVVRLFEHFLTGLGEEPLERVVARIHAVLDERLPPRAAAEARDLLARYLGYRTALGELDDARLAASFDLERRLQWLRELRREHFGARVAEALFGEEEAVARVRLEMRRVADDPALDSGQRRERIAALEQELPERARRTRERATAATRLLEREQALREAGASEAEIQAAREQLVGEAAAARRAARDRQRAAWEERLARYRAARDVLRADSSLEAAEREGALEALRASSFDEAERRRVRALDGVEPATPSAAPGEAPDPGLGQAPTALPAGQRRRRQPANAAERSPPGGEGAATFPAMALFDRDGPFARVNREAVLLLAGPRALLLQLAHPLVAAGVAEHSGFLADPLGRLRRTLDRMLTIIFGDDAKAHASAAAIRAVHRRVHGTLAEATACFPAGTAYDARDPELALWVHATLVESALVAYETFVAPLGEPEKWRYYEESKTIATLLEVPESVLPADLGAFRAWWDDMLAGPVLEVTPAAAGLADAVLHPPLPLLPRAVGDAASVVTVGLLPPPIRERFQLPWDGRREVAWRAARAVVRGALPLLPDLARTLPHARRASASLARRPQTG